MKCKISAHFHRYEDYVDQHYKEFLKNQGKVDSVRLAESAGGKLKRFSLSLSPRVTLFSTDP